MIRKIYFMGIKGVGMATLAVMARQAGFIVGGSDVEEEFITDKILIDAGIDVVIGFDSKNVSDFFGTTKADECLFIATGAHDGFENSEATYANEAGIKVISHGEAVGLFMNGSLFDRGDIEGISISGSHGKTTISSLIAALLTYSNLDPSYTIGTSEIAGIGAAGHYGQGRYFVAEADEYMMGSHDKTPKFLSQKPRYLIINNIDFDHPDLYSDLDAVVAAFASLVANLGPKDLIIANGDDQNVKKVIVGSSARVITYGTDPSNDFILKNYKQSGWESSFEVLRGETLIGTFSLSVPGYFNAKNALSAICLLMEIGVSPASIQKILPKFKGSRRRMELLGETQKGVLVCDDYAHHPEEIRKTLDAIKAAYPNKKIVCIFQAHTYARTKSLFSEFASAFSVVQELIIYPTFSSARDMGRVSLEDDRSFVEKIRTIQSNVKLIENPADVIKYIDKNTPPGSIVITMGAGDVYHIAEKLIAK